MEQMSLWDWMPEACPEKEQSKFPELIQELSFELFKMFINAKCEKETYRVWEHVPNLGKRYCLWVYSSEAFDWDKINELIERYKEHKLEVSVCASPAFTGELCSKYMISTMWLTKGHKEVQ